MKFKVGDRIVGNEKANWYGIPRQGWKGTVIKVHKSGMIDVCEDGEKLPFYLDPDCFDLVSGAETKRRIVIEITNDGAAAKYVVGKTVMKLATVKRYKEDNPDDYIAARYVLGKMFNKNISRVRTEDEISEVLDLLTESVRSLEKGRDKLSDIIKNGK